VNHIVFNGNGAKPTLAEHVAAASSWRDVLPIHPAAELFPRLSPDELKTLGEDIKVNGLQVPIVVRVEKLGDEWIYQLLDGRNRLDAIELVGFDPISPPRYKGRAEFRREGMDCGLKLSLGSPLSLGLQSGIRFECGLDEDEAHAFIISANIHRRHLPVEQKRELIAKLIKATPEKSDRQIAKAVKASPTTVGTVRAKMEGKGEVSKLDTRTDAKGVKQPAKKATAERNRKARERRAGARAQKRENELKAHEAEEAKAAAKAAQLAADLMKANLAQRVLACLRWQEGNPLLLQDALSDLLNIYNDPTPEASAAAMKAKFVAAGDGPDIPACLRRTLSGPLEEDRMVHIPPGAAL
jgi:hypothetical protein